MVHIDNKARKLEANTVCWSKTYPKQVKMLKCSFLTGTLVCEGPRWAWWGWTGAFWRSQGAQRLLSVQS